jgi:hypothetical protein
MQEQRLDLIDDSTLPSASIVTSTVQPIGTPQQCCIWSPSIALESLSLSPDDVSEGLKLKCIWCPSIAAAEHKEYANECILSPSHLNHRQLPAECCLVTHGCSGEIPTIIGNRRNTSMNAAVDNKALPLKQEIGGYVKKPAPCLKKIRISRHTVASSHQLTFGLLNVQSANNKIDDIIDMKKEHGLDVMLLSETWHDADSVSIRRLRAEGLQVIERSRPRSSMIGVNHGGVAIVASHGVRLSTSDAVNKRAVHTFEHSCVRVVSQVVYRSANLSSWIDRCK